MKVYGLITFLLDSNSQSRFIFVPAHKIKDEEDLNGPVNRHKIIVVENIPGLKETALPFCKVYEGISISLLEENLEVMEKLFHANKYDFPEKRDTELLDIMDLVHTKMYSSTKMKMTYKPKEELGMEMPQAARGDFRGMIVFLIDERYINHFYFVPKNKLRPEDRSGPVVRSKIIFLDNVDGLLKRKEFAVPFCKVCRGVSLEAIEKKVLETESRFRLMKYRYMSAKTNKDIIASMSCVELYLLPTTAEDKKVRPQHPESRAPSHQMAKTGRPKRQAALAAMKKIMPNKVPSSKKRTANGKARRSFNTSNAGSSQDQSQDSSTQSSQDARNSAETFEIDIDPEFLFKPWVPHSDS